MRERREKILILCCLVLGALLAFQLGRFLISGDPAKGLIVPALPSLPPELDAQATQTTNAPSTKGTNSTASAKAGTNVTAKAGSASNSPVVVTGAQSGNVSAVTTNNSATNTLSTDATNTKNSIAASVFSNSVLSSNKLAASPEKSTNLAPVSGASNVASAAFGTNATGVVSGIKGTNLAAMKTTNSAPAGRMNMPGKPAELPAEIKERVDRITQGEILAQVIRPMPMALLGIGGQHAFLRSPEGQTGMIKEGEQLGTLKLLRIGNNRVLVEQNGEKKELSIFDGLGSESLMPKEAKEKKTNEPPAKLPQTNASR